MSARGETASTPRLARATSGLRHLRWGREVLATLEAHIERNPTLSEDEREALRDEARALAGAVQALSGAVKPYRDFLERTRVHARGRVRVAEFLERASSGDEAARARIEEARAALADQEAKQRRPLKAALRIEIDRLRAAMERMDGRVGQRLSAAFVESLYPPLARADTRVADDGDPDDDATARDD